MSFSNQRRRMTLLTEHYGLKDTNSWPIKLAHFNVYTHMVVWWCQAGCAREDQNCASLKKAGSGILRGGCIRT